ncbi:8-amino-7-oxononanoate synthase [Paenibacillus psychroresistens]|uniref:8-amino-7-ketopelargonate synthase n=1 Tax=Paenibacillus psychroresistens TaxID=1778678 RepID=A0A6B8RTQ7_9BACL|nr:8-amino-7-oxononanoate synthase [Paenibacillus psychroresistens]QGQ98568.1 8-amino-7-oxononanoate synthase [Paenibacillus psychroresistens]
MSSMLQWMDAELRQLEDKSQLRSLTSASSLVDGFLSNQTQKLINLASNHYLGLDLQLSEETLKRLTEQAKAWGTQVGLGSTSSRLVVGSDPAFMEFEQVFAAFKGTESCLLFGSGFMANSGVIPALVGRHDVVFSDRLNHASIVDGINLSRAEHIRYRHRDLDQLEQQLKQVNPAKRKLIVTDTIFSMDGSLAPLKDLVTLKERYGAMLMVDEAHSGGVYGTNGEGLTHELGLTSQVDIQMGTFSKAYGCYGAYIAGDEVLRKYLINKARSFIYTTALPPLIVLAIHDNWLQAQRDSWRRHTLISQAAWFREQLKLAGFNIGESECQIVPLIVGANEITVALSQRLQQLGVAAVAIRPPTVPEGSARIRFSLTASITHTQLQLAVDHIKKAGAELGII